MKRHLALFLLCGGCDLFGGGGGGGGDGGVPDDVQLDAGAMVDAHNAARSNASPTPTPALPALTWSDAAAAVAERWAEQCTWQHNASRGPYGENLYANVGATTEADVVEGWASEVAHYDLGTNQCTPGEMCGHYTQLVWRDTEAVGCARRVCATGSPFGSLDGGRWELWVCNYSPPGNVVGRTPY